MSELARGLGAPPAELLEPCEGPQALGRSKLSAGQVERLWARDRKNLQACKNKHGAIVVYYTGRDKGLAGE